MQEVSWNTSCSITARAAPRSLKTQPVALCRYGHMPVGSFTGTAGAAAARVAHCTPRGASSDAARWAQTGMGTCLQAGLRTRLAQQQRGQAVLHSLRPFRMMQAVATRRCGHMLASKEMCWNRWCRNTAQHHA